MSSSVGTERPDPTQLHVWRSFLKAHATIARLLEAELLTGSTLSLGAYDVLVQLVESPGRALRMTDLAQAVLLSRSGVTRLVDRMERDGLVLRKPAEIDGRGVVAEITEEGIARLRAAATVHLPGVRRHFVNVLTDGELAAFGRSCERLLTDATSERGIDCGPGIGADEAEARH